MNIFVNPGFATFTEIVNSDFYVDKSEMIDVTNSSVDTPFKYICNSRPRRFGKSVTVDMLVAYYSEKVDTRAIFDKLKISGTADYEKFINKYCVIRYDVQQCISLCGSSKDVVKFINFNTLKELRQEFPGVIGEDVKQLSLGLSIVNQKLGKKFVFVIDEWDVLMRDNIDEEDSQREYIDFLRGLFKSSAASAYIALAYMTGILPIIRYKTQSALNIFTEYTMVNPDQFAPFVGFTEEEVLELCQRESIDFESAKNWYDGYLLNNLHVYNPSAIVNLVRKRAFRSYWSATGTYDALLPYIEMDFDGLRNDVIDMAAGAKVSVNTNTYLNDMKNFKIKDDILTMFIHLGYLAYDSNNSQVYIPNEEIRQEFISATRVSKWKEMGEFELLSDSILERTLALDAEYVGENVEKIHNDYISSLKYNDENSLCCTLCIAYLSSMNYYLKPFREFPSGKGFADLVYIPKPQFKNDYPPLLIELKWDQDVNSAMNQIKNNNYHGKLLGISGDILTIGINYDKKDKKHVCNIEKVILKD